MCETEDEERVFEAEMLKGLEMVKGREREFAFAVDDKVERERGWEATWGTGGLADPCGPCSACGPVSACDALSACGPVSACDALSACDASDT